MKISIHGAFGLFLAVAPAFAHHSTAAAYDEKKPVTLRGTVTKFDWTNPHVFMFVDAADASGKVKKWAIEFESRIELGRNGWTRDSVKVGDVVTVEGALARDGSKQASGKLVTLASGKKLTPPPSDARTASSRNSPPSKPAPRWPDGHVRLGFVPGETGYWSSPGSSNLIESTSANIRMNGDGLLLNLPDAD